MKLSSTVALLLWLGVAGVALAGPNAGGTLIVHDAGLAYTAETTIYPSAPPTLDPPAVDNSLPVEYTLEGWVWKVYAAFPAGSQPRLKALVLGEQFGAEVHVLAGGPPASGTFELPQDGWPTTSGGGVGLSFDLVQTAPVVEVYWFGGYGSLGGIWAVAPHPSQEMLFVDDQSPPNEDPIAGLSTIGFGIEGSTVYPVPPSPQGACCFPSGDCELLPELECSGVWYGAESVCEPNPCPIPPTGACCWSPGWCELSTESDCSTGVWLEGLTCEPNPCPQPPYGACCFPDGQCQYRQQVNCHTGSWLEGLTCEPNPCPQPPYGACCFPSGLCLFLPQLSCPEDWLGEGTTCDPNPCPQPPPTGACCAPSGDCYILSEADCPYEDWTIDLPCSPNPCPQPPSGACCHANGVCTYVPEHACSTGDWREGIVCLPNPCPVLPAGACCYADGHCVFTQETYCPTGDWRESTPCTPNPCPPPAPTGACCFAMGCSITTQAECSGSWLGPGTDCTPNPCCTMTAGRRTEDGGRGDPTTSAPEGQGVLPSGTRPDPCPPSTLHQNDDGSIEDAFSWQYQGVAAPDYGSFAEGYPNLSGMVCGIGLLLTRWGTMTGAGAIDVYVWDFDAATGNPGTVLEMLECLGVADVPFWPNFTEVELPAGYVYALNGCFVGYWPRSFVGVLAEYGCGLDLDGPGGWPRTNIAPGIGYPTGWNDPAVAGYWAQSFGIRAYEGGGSTPTLETSWGRIKQLYHPSPATLR